MKVSLGEDLNSNCQCECISWPRVPLTLWHTTVAWGTKKQTNKNPLCLGSMSGQWRWNLNLKNHIYPSVPWDADHSLSQPQGHPETAAFLVSPVLCSAEFGINSKPDITCIGWTATVGSPRVSLYMPITYKAWGSYSHLFVALFPRCNWVHCVFGQPAF